jgi:radical SAM superfamily enzyme YgiQ (UPF0313 family)
VVEEIQSIEEDYILFADDEAFLVPERMWKIADLIEKRKIRKKYQLIARSDTIVRHKDLFKKWRTIGLDRVFVGFEAIDDSRLKKLNKGTTVGTNEEAIRILRSLGVNILADFIVSQDFTREDFSHLREYVRKWELPSAIFTILTPMPGTAYYESVKSDLLSCRFEHFDVMHSLLPTDMRLDDFYREFYFLYKHSSNVFQKLKFVFRIPPRDLFRLVKLYGSVTRKLKACYVG